MPGATTIPADNETPPKHGKLHEALSVFLGDWKAEGASYGSPDQSETDPKAHAEKWTSTVSATWFA